MGGQYKESEKVPSGGDIPVGYQMLNLLLQHEEHEDEESLHGVAQIRDVEDLRPLLVAAHNVRDDLR